MNNILIEISFGELIDRLSILNIKLEKIKDKEKLIFIHKEYDETSKKSYNILMNKNVEELYHNLIDINTKLWDVEDKLRIKEYEKSFDDEFIEMARMVYKYNDERFSLKTKINIITNSDIREQKSYKKYWS